MGELLLDADTQTSNDDILHNSIETRMPRKEWSLEISDQVAEAHIDLITRVNELEIQNHDILKKISTIGELLADFKRQWEKKNALEKEADVLLRNVGILS